jgi:hypothetical protein
MTDQGGENMEEKEGTQDAHGEKEYLQLIL